jgi:polar amino acid transport system substrate-binding protein
MVKYGKFVALIAVAALAVGALALVGCSQATPPSTTGTTPTSTTAPAADLKLVAPGVLTIGSDTAFPPFESMSGSTAEGFDVDLGAAIAKELGLTSVFKSYKFDTLIPTLVAGGKFDIIMSGMTINADRQKEIDFADPYIDSNQSIAVKNSSTAKSAADLTGKKIGVQSGTTGQQWAKENIKGATLVPFDDVLSAFSALQAGKVEAVVNDLPVSAAIVKDATRGLKIIQEIPTGEQYGIAVSKSNPDLLKAINDALAKVKASGEYATIYTKWFGVAPSSK